MQKKSITGLVFIAIATSGCAGTLVEPGHRALLFDPTNGGIQHEVLQPGWYRTACPFWMATNKCPRVDDFDVTFSTAKEQVHTLSTEGLPIDLHIAVVYRPIVSELYLLDTEIGIGYFEEVIGPEFRSAAIGVFAHTSYQDLQRKNGTIEDEIEKELRQRLRNRHVEISSVLIEKVTYDSRIMESLQARVVTQQESLAERQRDENKAALEKHRIELQTDEIQTRAAHRKVELEAQTDQKKLEATADLELKKIQIQKETDEEKFRIESQLRNKKMEKQLTMEQAQIDRMKADAESSTKVVQARAEATARLALASAAAAETQAESANITTNQVMMHAYDALGKLGGTGTSFMLGDWSKLPNWLFPRMPGFQSAFGGMWPGMVAQQEASNK